MREETGVEVEVERITEVYKNLPRGIVAMVFRCRPLSDAVTSTDEATRVAWLTVDEVTGHMDPAYAVRVTDALADGPSSRAHDCINLVSSTAGAP